MIDKDRGLKLLGSGLGPVDVATALGCDPSFISQWLMDDAFRANVLALRMESLHLQTKRDREIDSIEDELIEKLKENIKYMVKTNDIIRAFAILNNAKRRGAASGGDLHLHQNVLSITLPEAAREKLLPKTNAHGEVVQVGEQITTTANLTDLVRSRLALQKKSGEITDVLLEDLTARSESEVPSAAGSRKESAGTSNSGSGSQAAA